MPLTGGPQGSEGQQQRNGEKHPCAAAGVDKSHDADPPAQGRGKTADDSQGLP